MIRRSLLVLILLAALPLAARAAEPTKVREGNPPFRTELAVELRVGGFNCLGGSDFADCQADNAGWTMGWGFGGGLAVRPFRYVSVALETNVSTISPHKYPDRIWRDLTVGPLVRGHLPVHLLGLYVEPTLGVGGGFLQTWMDDPEASANDVSHRLSGAYLLLLAALDVYPIPKLGFGPEVRVVRSFYQEVCYDGATGLICRDADNEEMAVSLSNGAGVIDTSEKPVVDFPWNIQWGLHAIYWF